MVRLGAKRFGVFVGAILAGAMGCGVDPSSAADLTDEGASTEPFEFVQRPEQLVIPAASRHDDSNAICASEIIAAQPVPVNLYLMIDRSGSMQEGNKWGQSMGALRAFIEDPETSGLRVALRFFGDNAPVVGCSEQQCSIEACAEPLVPSGELRAEVGALDAQESELTARLEHTLPINGLGTPIYPALGGALRWATTHKATHPDEKVAVVFLTDGEPNGCDTNIEHISSLAKVALESSEVQTYAIGLQGSNEQQMHAIASAGGTRAGIFIGENGRAEIALLDALTTIRRRSMSCDFQIPAPMNGKMADVRTVNLDLTTGSEQTPLYRVDDRAACSGDGMGWYFDDASRPSRIHLCPSACERSNAEPDAQVSVVLGCLETRREPLAVR